MFLKQVVLFRWLEIRRRFSSAFPYPNRRKLPKAYSEVSYKSLSEHILHITLYGLNSRVHWFILLVCIWLHHLVVRAHQIRWLGSFGLGLYHVSWPWLVASFARDWSPWTPLRLGSRYMGCVSPRSDPRNASWDRTSGIAFQTSASGLLGATSQHRIDMQVKSSTRTWCVLTQIPKVEEMGENQQLSRWARHCVVPTDCHQAIPRIMEELSLENEEHRRPPLY